VSLPGKILRGAGKGVKSVAGAGVKAAKGVAGVGVKAGVAVAAKVALKVLETRSTEDGAPLCHGAATRLRRIEFGHVAVSAWLCPTCGLWVHLIAGEPK